MDIVVTDDSYIQSFNYHFITPIQQHLNRINVVVTPERVEYRGRGVDSLEFAIIPP